MKHFHIELLQPNLAYIWIYSISFNNNSMKKYKIQVQIQISKALSEVLNLQMLLHLEIPVRTHSVGLFRHHTQSNLDNMWSVLKKM